MLMATTRLINTKGARPSMRLRLVIFLAVWPAFLAGSFLAALHAQTGTATGGPAVSGAAHGGAPATRQAGGQPGYAPPTGGGFAAGLGDARSVFMAPYPEYRIGPHDLIEIDVYEAPEFRRTLRVSPAGSVRLPLCRDSVDLSGLTYLQAEAAVAQALVDEGLLVDPIVAVNVREAHGNPVQVTGSVRQPVVFPAVGPTTLLDAIAQAGGLDAPGREIVITRPAKEGLTEETLRIPIAEFSNGLNGAQAVPLYGGETVRVVPAEKAFLMGAIQNPGAIDVIEPEGMEFLKLLASAGGLEKESNNKAIILRASADSPGDRERIEIDVNKILKFEVFDVRVQPGDVVYFPTSRGKQFLYRMVDAAAFQIVWQGMGFLWR